MEVVALVGETALRSGAAVARRARTRSTDVLQQVCEAGAAALGIVAVVNGLIGRSLHLLAQYNCGVSVPGFI